MVKFKIEEQDVIRVPVDSLRIEVESIFRSFEMTPEDAALATDVLVSADLRGVDSHGVSNLVQRYVDEFRTGHSNPNPQWRVIRETLATANIDSDRGLGVVVAPKAMNIAIEKAKQTGVGIVTVRNARHLGMAGYHAMLALEHDMIGICMTSCSPKMIPTYGSEPRLGTNPIALAAPAGVERPFVFDAATTVMADNKIKIARRLGALLPPGVLADERGTPIMEPILPTEQFRMLPLGAMKEMGSHKGYGLACIVDILGGILSGGGYGFLNGRGVHEHFLAAYNIEAFGPIEEFKETMDEFLSTLRTTPPAPGHDRVFYPGLPDWEMEQERRELGIPLHKEVVESLRKLSDDLGIA
jgi:L-2-hydroxycarboxylate dehydrogenase (NAD+)